MQTIQAHVSARILSKAGRLFTNRTSQILIELLQNARRAGASQITVTTSPTSNPAATVITFTDNGSGIDDFNKLLYLGSSGWDESVERAEDPAGMGLFALLHSGVVVSSRGKAATITTDAFLGKEAVEVRDQESANPETGTTLVFTRPETEASITDTLRRVARFGPVDVTLNGELLKREDFLAGAEYIKEVDGVRIGIFIGSSEPMENCNFHGNLIRATLLDHDITYAQVLAQVHRSTMPLKVTARLDILSTASLHLKLPDRTDLVYDEAYDGLRKQVRRAVLEYLATDSVQHIAPFAVYKEALELGIPLKEASPYLQPFFVSARDSNSTRTPFDGDHNDGEATVHDPVTCALVDLEDDYIIPSSFAFDLASRDHKIPRLPVRKDTRFKGYSWYDSLARVTNFKLTIDGEPADDVVATEVLTIVNSIQLSFDLVRSGASPEQVLWNLPFAGWGGDDYDEVTLFITRDSEWATTGSPYQPFSLIAAAQHLVFDPSDDPDADSFDTQEEYFQQRYEESITKVLGGTIAAARLALTRTLDWTLTNALNAANLPEVRLVREEDGKWRAELPTSA